MNVTYACPACHAGVCQEFDQSSTALACPHCSQSIAIAPGSVEGNRVRCCLTCPSRELFVRKDFPQRVGVMLVAIGVIGSSIAWYYASLAWTFGILFATALADLALFAVVGEALMCYRCGALYRGVAEMEAHGEFNLETHEKYRQLAARMKPSAGAPSS
jgi:DNA-directed RNA polymerase subunit RPC12/RpoP